MNEGKSAGNSSPAVLDYAQPTLFEPLPLSRTALCWCRLAAGLLGLLTIAVLILLSFSGKGMGFVPQAVFVIALLLLQAGCFALCATLFLRTPFAPRHLPILLLVLLLTFGLRCLTDPAIIQNKSYGMGFAAGHAKIIASNLFLLLPVVLVRIQDEERWWKWLRLIAAGCAIGLTIEGLGQTLRFSMMANYDSFLLSTFFPDSGPLSELSALLNRFWGPIRLLAGVLLGIGLLHGHRRRLLAAGILLMALSLMCQHGHGLVFIALSVQHAISDGAYFFTLLLLVSALITAPLPIWFLGYVLWRHHDSVR